MDSTAQVYQHNFTSCPPAYAQGQAIYTYALDLNGGGWSLLYGQCRDNPACTYYPNNSQPIGYLDGIAYGQDTMSGSANLVGWQCSATYPACRR